MFLSIKPKIIVFFTTYKCDSQCIMCSVWRRQVNSKELSLEQIEKIFSDKIISSNLEFINLTGGEPTLRPDLCDIVKILLKYCYRLKRIDIPTNGINTQQVLDQAEKILALLLPSDVKLSICVSLDGVENIHEKIRGIPGIFNKVDRTIQGLKELFSLYSSLSLGLNAVVNKLNYQNLKEIKDYAAKNNLGINFTLAAISEIGVGSIATREKFEIGEEEAREIIPFFKELVDKREINHIYGKFILNLLETRKRNNGCAFRSGKAILIEPNGDAYMCGNFKDFKLGSLKENMLTEILKNKRKFPKIIWQKCLRCESNCYLN